MLAVTFILLMVFMSGRFIKYLAKAASGGISPEIILAIMAYRLPGFLELILPLGFFIGILLAYGRMYLESEMTVLHACGYSQRRLVGISLLMSMCVAMIVGVMSLYVSPWGMAKVESLLQEEAAKTEFEMLFPGKFQYISSGNSVTYVESVSEDKRSVSNVFIAQKNEGDESLQLVYANSATQKFDENGDRYLLLEKGASYQGLPGHADYQVVEFAQYGMRLQAKDIGERVGKDEAIPTERLLNEDSLQASALLQWRISIPLLVPIVTLIAVSVSRVNPRQGRFVHLFPAMLVYVAYLGLLIVARKNIAKGELEPWIGLWSVHAVFFGLGLTLISKNIWMSWFKKKGERGAV